MASRTFARTSSTVLPCDTQRGNAGTSAQKPPSSAARDQYFESHVQRIAARSFCGTRQR
jgi:hypothetical protein